MSKLSVKNGTPTGNANMCRNCSWGQFIIGYRESDLLAICTNTSPNTVLPFTVMDCSSFSDKFRPDWEQMKKLAINIQPVRVSKKTTGFSPTETLRPTGLKPEDEDGCSSANINQQQPTTCRWRRARVHQWQSAAQAEVQVRFLPPGFSLV